VTTLLGIPELSGPITTGELNFSDFQPPSTLPSGFLENTRSSKILELQSKTPQLELDYQKNQSGPELELILGQNYDKSTRFSTVTNRNETIVGVQLEMPIGDSVQEAEIKNAQYLLRRAEIGKQIFNQNLSSSL